MSISSKNVFLVFRLLSVHPGCLEIASGRLFVVNIGGSVSNKRD